MHFFSFRQWPNRSGSAFGHVSGNDGLHPVLHLFSFRQWRTTSGSARPSWQPRPSYRSWWRPNQSLTPFSGSASPALESRYSRCSAFESRSSENLLANPAPLEAGGGQARVRQLSLEVPVQPSSPGIPTAQSSSLGTPRTCSQVQILSTVSSALEFRIWHSSYLKSWYCHVLQSIQVHIL